MDDATYLNLLQRVLDTIAHNHKIKTAKKDDNNNSSNSIIELYPLCDQPRTQIIPKVFKNHIHGLLFALNMLCQKGDNININQSKVVLFVVCFDNKEA